ncbi:MULTISPECIES: hypothetical protein [unclassified Rhizobium]|uniref:hypothetical protein n=1 Tax=unclassified Rhizobium TaxID=2613769 RepID=UPI001611F8F9|nr:MULTISPECIES: hypothetical protein [unclassified Rhizobium]MBB3288184.1 hypothetical protein [Rhizobium sp. BK252]MBB3402952.1 hypothetical protein [Rhizobium sp. BK289]MBB3415529.1 hypothetical protein [Rhizobium sp. BK284]MBB3483390.1 hypothetical protein [Rhizobium sp. BK347]
MNHFTPAIGRDEIIDRDRKLQRELATMPPAAYQARRSNVEELIDLLREAQIWRMRLIELTFASVIFFWLGFFVAARCL